PDSFTDNTPGRFGIHPVHNDDEEVVIKRNQVMHWSDGIYIDSANKTVRKNQISLNLHGLTATPPLVVGNVITANRFGGIDASGTGKVVGNAMYDNGGYGLFVFGDNPTIERNNMVGNGYGGFDFDNVRQYNCGLANWGIADLVAANNYWGAATGPGNDPA